MKGAGMPKAERTAEQKEAARVKAEATRALDRSISDLAAAAYYVANRAGQIELHAEKNKAAGYGKGASNKLQHAQRLRRIAAFLDDSRLHRFIRENEDLRKLLMGDPPKPLHAFGVDHMKPRKIDPGEVRPTHPKSRPYYDGDFAA